MNTLTQKELNKAGCATPNGDHDHSILYLMQRCHPNMGASVRYVKETGVLHIDCQLCEQPIAVIKVAE